MALHLHDTSWMMGQARVKSGCNTVQVAPCGGLAGTALGKVCCPANLELIVLLFVSVLQMAGWWG